MSATAIGLALDMAGALVLGFVVPRYQVATVTSSGWPIATKSAGKTFERCAWIAVVLGFALQLVGVL